jgi:hypothetical protein
MSDVERERVRRYTFPRHSAAPPIIATSNAGAVMLQARIGAGAVVLGLAAHAAYVHRERARAPTGRLLQFSPGSQGERSACNGAAQRYAWGVARPRQPSSQCP